MQLPIFQNAYFLQSVGWSIANSFWQAALLWLLYQVLVTFNKRMSSLVKHYLSVILMIISFTWFVYTLNENYRLLLNTGILQTSVLPNNVIYQLQKINEVLPLLSILYFAVLFFYLIQFARKLGANQVLQRKGLTKPVFDIRIFIRSSAKHLGIKKNIEVWISSYVDVPSVTGFFKPIILLPVAITNDLSVNQVEAILIHELAHIKRNDYIINLFQSVIETVLFFNPFVLLIGKAARKERENCCDDWVLNYQYDQHDYALALLQIEERRHFKQAFVLAATGSKKILLQRIKRLFHSSIQSPNLRNIDRFKFIGLGILVFLGTFTIIPKLSIKNIVKDQKPLVQPISSNSALLPPVLNELNIRNNKIISGYAIKTETALDKTPDKTKTSKPLIKALEVKPVTEIYMNAYINEDLLSENPNTELAPTLAADKESDAKKYFIKIEEQVSGNAQTNTYYLELNNKDGDANIKPLIILEKRNISTRKIISKKSTDSTLIKPVKKRITL
ncbi:hypothetical protein BH11BAC3_BH11BAC3_26340 [soil metagenome]